MAARSPHPPSPPTGAPADPLDGTPYRVIARLGAGGMGEVVEAEHRALRKRVVVKLIHEVLSRDPRFADRLRVEAQALAALSSPHVVAVSDLGRTPEGRAYLVMERLHGCTLREELDLRGPLPVGEAVVVARQVLSGLSAAHRLGIVHRDVKLENVFLCAADERGQRVVKVLDFGIAKVLRPEAAVSPLAPPQYPTEEGTLVGSPRTVAPEQIRCQRVDARTDVYAVGLLIYALLVGRGPFAQNDMLALLNAHLLEEPAPPSLLARQGIPAELDRAILRALAKRPEHRFQSAAEFAAALEGIGMGPAGEVAEGSRTADAAAATVDLNRTLVSAPAPDAGRRELRLIAVLALASTVVFALVAALALRYVDGGR